VRDGRLYVSYPLRRADGGTSYGSGFPIGAVPPIYRTDPPSAITADRAALWAALLGRCADAAVRDETQNQQQEASVGTPRREETSDDRGSSSGVATLGAPRARARMLGRRRSTQRSR
jgi:hypothetical protein